MRTYIIPASIIDIEIKILGISLYSFKLNRDLVLVILSVLLKLFLENLGETIGENISSYKKQYLVMGSPSESDLKEPKPYLIMDNNNNAGNNNVGNNNPANHNPANNSTGHISNNTDGNNRRIVGVK